PDAHATPPPSESGATPRAGGTAAHKRPNPPSPQAAQAVLDAASIAGLGRTEAAEPRLRLASLPRRTAKTAAPPPERCTARPARRIVIAQRAQSENGRRRVWVSGGL